MSRQRTLRRAAERAAQKSLAATGSVPASQVFTGELASSLSDARRAANRANAQHSTGPITPEGRAISARNALQHGLTGNTILLDSDDAEAYQAQLGAHVDQFRPIGYEERRLVQSMHDCAWRLDRILMLESTIYARGRRELESAFEAEPLPHRKHFIDYEISQRYAKQLRNLHIQEARLQRQRAKDLQALTSLQTTRRAEEKAAAEAAAKTPPPPPAGFVFENAGNGVQLTPAISAERNITPPLRDGN